MPEPFLPFANEPVIDQTSSLFTTLYRKWAEDLQQRVTQTRDDLDLALATVFQDTHANRVGNYDPTDYDPGVLFFETDRGILYRVNAANTAWVYALGQMQAARADAPSDLGANDVGFLLYVSDFFHTVRWDGAAWQWACGCRPTQRGDFAVAPGDGWVLCDGSASSYLSGVGTNALTATAIVLPNIPNGTFYKSLSPYTGAVDAAVAPGISGSTANESAHTHDVDPPNTQSNSNEGVGAPDVLMAGADYPLLHAHSTNIASFASGAGSAHAHSVGSLAVDSAGRPPSSGWLPYFRR